MVCECGDGYSEMPCIKSKPVADHEDQGNANNLSQLCNTTQNTVCIKCSSWDTCWGSTLYPSLSLAHARMAYHPPLQTPIKQNGAYARGK